MGHTPRSLLLQPTLGCVLHGATPGSGRVQNETPRQCTATGEVCWFDWGNSMLKRNEDEGDFCLFCSSLLSRQSTKGGGAHRAPCVARCQCWRGVKAEFMYTEKESRESANDGMRRKQHVWLLFQYQLKINGWTCPLGHISVNIPAPACLTKILFLLESPTKHLRSCFLCHMIIHHTKAPA